MSKLLNHFLILLAILFFVHSIESCNRCDPTYLGSYYLSDEQKSWINFQNSQVIFKNQHDSSQVFTYSEATGYPQSNFCTATKCGGIEYTNEFRMLSFSSDSFPYLLTLKLEAVYDSFFCILSKSGSLSITDYNYSNWLQIQVPESIPLMNTCYLADSILLNNKTFYSVYTSYYGSAQTGLDKVYFKMDLGIIGFQTEDSSVWVLSQ